MQGYFDTLRMELADTGVGVLNVCPGPVDTPFMRELFGKEIVQKQKVVMCFYALALLSIMCTINN